MNKTTFRECLATHIRAKMEAEGMSLADVSEGVKGACSKNWVFRAMNDSDIGVPHTLIAILDWLDLDPRDMTLRNQQSEPGHVMEAIMCLRGHTIQQREQLWAVVSAYLRADL